MLLTDDGLLFGCGSNREGKLSFVGDTDSSTEPRQISTSWFRAGERIKTIQGNDDCIFVQTNDAIYVLGNSTAYASEIIQ